MSRSAVIVDAVRSPMGRGKPPKDDRPGEALSGVHPAELLGRVIGKLMDRSGIAPQWVDDLIPGCVSQVDGMANATIIERLGVTKGHLAHAD